MANGQPTLQLNEAAFDHPKWRTGYAKTPDPTEEVDAITCSGNIPRGFLNQAEEELSTLGIEKILQDHWSSIRITFSTPNLHTSREELRNKIFATIGTIRRAMEKSSSSRNQGRKEPGERQFVNRAR